MKLEVRNYGDNYVTVEAQKEKAPTKMVIKSKLALIVKSLLLKKVLIKI
jgi:hypothetical protein